MTTNQTPRAWPTVDPIVVFMVPAESPVQTATMMRALTADVLYDLGWQMDSVELVGLMSTNSQHGIEEIYFLDETGVDVRRIALLMLWGESCDCIQLQDVLSYECGKATVVLLESGVVIPTLCVPSIDDAWWTDPLNHAHTVSTYGKTLKNGRSESYGPVPSAFVALPPTWN